MGSARGAIQPDVIGEVLAAATAATAATSTPVAGLATEVVSRFVERYLAGVPLADLAARPPTEVAAAARAHLAHGLRRAPGQVLVAVTTPRSEASGRPGHSMVDVVVDDMPFLLDSLTAALHRRGVGIHLVVHPVLAVRRDGDRLVDITDAVGDGSACAESWTHLEVDRQPGAEAEADLEAALVAVLADVRVAVQDWGPMRQRALDLADDISARMVPCGPEEAAEVAALLRWLADGHMIVLGARDDDLSVENDGDDADVGDDGKAGDLGDGTSTAERPVAGSGLGLLRDDHPGHEHHLPPLPGHGVRRRVRERRLFRATRVPARSPVLRPDELTCIAIARYDPAGRFVGEHRLIGLLTATAYRIDADEIPVVRRKLATVLDRAGYPLHSHSGRELRTILGTYPRDELFQVDVDVLETIALGVLALQERQQVRLFPRWDPDGRFVSALVYLPRERYSTGAAERIERVLVDAYGGIEAEHSAHFGESVLARLHVIVRLPDGTPPPADPVQGAGPPVPELEARLAAVTRWWSDDLRDALVAEVGEDTGLALARRYGDALPASYREANDAAAAVADLRQLAALEADGDAGIATALYRPPGAGADELRLKLYTPGNPVTLTRILPLLEDMGVEVVDERPFEVRPADAPPAWIYDIGLRVTAPTGAGAHVALPGGADDRAAGLEEFQRVFAATWRGEVESDGLNRLVLRAGLTGTQVQVVRAYTRYLRQVGATYTPAYLEDTLARHPRIVRSLIALFELRLDPGRQGAGAEAVAAEATALIGEISTLLDGVASLDEDRILRALLDLVVATTRTNLYRPDRGRGAKPVIALKLDPSRIPDLPLPRPMFEIWVHGPQVEGVHLRGGPVARGGLRWSDRREDVRTEVLGLMKAQMVKNAVIVPTGAKGGFVLRRPPIDADALRREVRECYRSFVAGLLDVTDNLVAGAVVPPPGVIRHDGDDPYLVVAADKGTASFSDLANEVAEAYGFWLGDAFASGGSAGYDHKAMGITARGAWCSVERHFRTLGIDLATAPITVVGIGDMSGDVFGNGMLLSPHLRLVAAFDHRHVFVDPDPDPTAGFAERRRLFELPRSSWDDYDRKRISSGGGVWARTAKAVPLSDEMRRALAVDAATLTPAELISAILRAPVDLLWNGGIGTYVKASGEHHGEVGDRANDAVRVNGAELRCRVVGEGGNLGFTQAGRIEYALGGGLVNTDAIDNSAGVDCSDHEVNIKITLDAAVAGRTLGRDERNTLLASMTDEVAELVLDHNREQNLALAMARAQAGAMVDVHTRLIRDLEHEGLLNRGLERLPTDKQLAERQSAGEGLTGPEFAVLLAYAKTTGVAEAVASDLPDDPWLEPVLLDYFPTAVRDGFPGQVCRHRLRRDIIATRVVNDVVNVSGTSFCYRMATETGAPLPEVLRAHLAASAVFGRGEQWSAVEGLAATNTIDAATELALLLDLRRMLERAVLWLLRHRRPPLDLAGTVAAFAPGVEELAVRMYDCLVGSERRAVEERAHRYVGARVPEPLARRAAVWPLLHLGLDIVEIAAARGRSAVDVAAAELGVIERLDLGWLRERIGGLPRADRWQSLARAALRDDFQTELRALTGEVVRSGDAWTPPAELVERWVEHNRTGVERLRQVYEEIRAAGTYDLTTLSVALRQLRNLLFASQPVV